MRNVSWAFVYGIVFEGKVMYVGVTMQDVRKRLSSHVSKALSDNTTPYYKLKLHPWLRANFQNITVQILEVCPSKNRFEREQYYIALHRTTTEGLNCEPFKDAPGREKQCKNPSGAEHYAAGKAGSTRKAVLASAKARRGKKLPESTKKKMREARAKYELNARNVKNIDTGVCYGSLREASNSVGLTVGAVFQALKRGTKCGGYCWRYEN